MAASMLWLLSSRPSESLPARFAVVFVVVFLGVKICHFFFGFDFLCHSLLFSLSFFLFDCLFCDFILYCCMR